MATKVGSLIAELGLDTARFEAGIKTATNSVSRFHRKAERKFQKLNKAAGVAATGMVAAYTTAFSVMTKQTLDLGDQLAKLETRLGVSVEGMSGLKFAAEQSGVSFQTLTMGMQRMIRRVGEAANGTGEAEVALLELGLSAKKLAQLKPENQFRAIAEALSGVANANDRARLAQKLFDSEGVALLQLMEDGAAGIDAYMQRANELGVVMSHTTAKGAEEAKNALGEVKAVMYAASLESTQNMIPAITMVANELASTIPTASNLAVKAFLNLRKEGLGVLSFLVNRYATLKLMVGEALEKMGATDLAAGEYKDAQFLANFSKELLESSREAGAALAQTFGQVNTNIKEIPVEKIDEVDSAFGRVNLTTAKMLADMKSIGETIEVDIFDKSKTVFEQMADNFKKAVKDMVNAWVNSKLRDIFLGKTGENGDRTGGILSAVMKSLPGFATGGSFEVGGRGGTDSNVVAFKATKGEQVTIQTPQQQRMGGGVVINNTYNVSGGGVSRGEVQAIVEQGQAQTKAQIADQMSRRRF